MKHFIIILIIFSCSQNKSNDFLIKKSKDHLQKKINLKAVIEKKNKNDTLFFQLTNFIVFFINKDKKNECWREIEIKNLHTEKVVQVKTPLNFCFEKNDLENFSPSQNFLLLHAIERGIVSDQKNKTEVEKYYCIFLDIQQKKISKKHNNMFCSGEWEKPDKWTINDNQSYSTDELFSF